MRHSGQLSKMLGQVGLSIALSEGHGIHLASTGPGANPRHALDERGVKEGVARNGLAC